MGVEAKPALPVLMELQQSEDVHDRRLAAMVLGSLAQDLTEAMPPLLHALKDVDEGVCRLVAEALDEIAPHREHRKAA
jgi:HEAT repeat protein